MANAKLLTVETSYSAARLSAQKPYVIPRVCSSEPSSCGSCSRSVRWQSGRIDALEQQPAHHRDPGERHGKEQHRGAELGREKESRRPQEEAGATDDEQDPEDPRQVSRARDEVAADHGRDAVKA